jgi:hypothetical protein
MLRQLASWTVADLSKSPDDQVRNAACAATVEYSRDEACLSALRAVMGDGNATFAVRLLAVNALRTAHDPYGDKALATIAGQAAATSPVDAAAMLAKADPAVAVPLLRAMLATDDPQQQYAAATVLAGIPGKAAADALASNIDHVTGAAKTSALAGMAANGDAASRKKIVDALPLLRGRDLLVAGRALQRAGDPAGARALTGLLSSDDEVTALDAADSLRSSAEATRARAAIHAALRSRYPAVRAQALRIWNEAGWPSDADVRRLLTDGDPWVRVQAAATVMHEALPRAPKHP